MSFEFAHRELVRKRQVRYTRDDKMPRLSHAANMASKSKTAHPVPVGWFLKQWREEKGLSGEKLAELAGTSKGYVSNLENGVRRYNQDWVERFAHALGIDGPDLFRDPREKRQKTPKIVGHVAAGDEGYFLDDYELGAGEELPPLEDDGLIALRVSGPSMTPRFRPGEILIMGPRIDDPHSLINREVMAVISAEDNPPEHAGRRVVKLLRASTKGRWTLFSINNAYDPIEDVRLDWVLPIVGARF